MFSFLIHFNLFLQLNDVSICTLAECIQNNTEYDLFEALEPNQILEVLGSIADHQYTQDDFYGKDDDEMEELNVSMKRLILAYVQNNCECIL